LHLLNTPCQRQRPLIGHDIRRKKGTQNNWRLCSIYEKIVTLQPVQKGRFANDIEQN
jgi:hypothetical protein